MSKLTSLQFVVVPKSFSADPAQARRMKFLAHLEQQHELAKDENDVVRRKR